MRLSSAIPILAAIFLLSVASETHAQDPQPESSSKPAGPPNDDMKPKSPGKQKKDSATQNAPDQPAWDPLRAGKDLEVSEYYLKNGYFDASIDRFHNGTL